MTFCTIVTGRLESAFAVMATPTTLHRWPGDSLPCLDVHHAPVAVVTCLPSIEVILVCELCCDAPLRVCALGSFLSAAEDVASAAVVHFWGDVLMTCCTVRMRLRQEGFPLPLFWGRRGWFTGLDRVAALAPSLLEASYPCGVSFVAEACDEVGSAP